MEISSVWVLLFWTSEPKSLWFWFCFKLWFWWNEGDPAEKLCFVPLTWTRVSQMVPSVLMWDWRQPSASLWFFRKWVKIISYFSCRSQHVLIPVQLSEETTQIIKSTFQESLLKTKSHKKMKLKTKTRQNKDVFRISFIFVWQLSWWHGGGAVLSQSERSEVVLWSVEPGCQRNLIY